MCGSATLPTEFVLTYRNARRITERVSLTTRDALLMLPFATSFRPLQMAHQSFLALHQYPHPKNCLQRCNVREFGEAAHRCQFDQSHFTGFAVDIEDALCGPALVSALCKSLTIDLKRTSSVMMVEMQRTPVKGKLHSAKILCLPPLATVVSLRSTSERGKDRSY